MKKCAIGDWVTIATRELTPCEGKQVLHHSRGIVTETGKMRPHNRWAAKVRYYEDCEEFDAKPREQWVWATALEKGWVNAADVELFDMTEEQARAHQKEPRIREWARAEGITREDLIKHMRKA